MKLRERRRHKTRLYGKNRLSMPKPKKKSKGRFELRLIDEADSRFTVVKEMRNRIQQLIDDAALTSVQQHWLAARAVFIVGFLESLEVAAMEGTEIEWGSYVQATNALSGILKSLGLAKKLKKEVDSLESYLRRKK